MTLRLINSGVKYNQNLLINGAFDYWQRGTTLSLSGTASTGYIADRFRHDQGGSSPASTYSRSTNVPNSTFTYSLNLLQTSASTANSFATHQIVEADYIRPFIGREVTLSVWVRGLTNSVGLSAYYPNSKDTWPSRVTDFNQIGTIAGTTDPSVWTRLVYTFTVPAGAVNGLAVSLFTTPGGVNRWAEVTGFQLEPGTQATSFNRSSVNDEFAPYAKGIINRE